MSIISAAFRKAVAPLRKIPPEKWIERIEPMSPIAQSVVAGFIVWHIKSDYDKNPKWRDLWEISTRHDIELQPFEPEIYGELFARVGFPKTAVLAIIAAQRSKTVSLKYGTN